MKLRLRHNSLRLRLTRGEVDRFLETGRVEEEVEFPHAPLIFSLQLSGDCRGVEADFMDGRITVNVPEAAGRAWASGEDVGMKSSSQKLSILVEKDWECVHAAAEENEDVFPHP